MLFYLPTQFYAGGAQTCQQIFVGADKDTGTNPEQDVLPATKSVVRVHESVSHFVQAGSQVEVNPRPVGPKTTPVAACVISLLQKAHIIWKELHFRVQIKDQSITVIHSTLRQARQVTLARGTVGKNDIKALSIL